MAAVLWVRRWRGGGEREVCGVVVRDVIVSGARKSRTSGALRDRALGVSSRAAIVFAIVMQGVCYCCCIVEVKVEVTATATATLNW